MLARIVAGRAPWRASCLVWVCRSCLLILLLVVLIFGTSRIPELGKGLGEGIKNFKKGLKGEEEKKP